MDDAIENVSENAMDAVPGFDCSGWTEAFLNLAYWTLVAAAVLGALYVVAAVIAAFRRPPPAALDREGGGGVIDAVTGLIETLTKAPAWFALFVAGLALVWVASSQIPAICRPVEEGAKAEPEPGPAVSPTPTPAPAPAPTGKGTPDREA